MSNPSSTSTSTPTSSIERAGMLHAVRTRLTVLAHRYLCASKQVEDAHSRADGILPADCTPPEQPAPPRIHEVALRDMGVADDYTWRRWTTASYWPRHLPAVTDSALRELNPSETLALLDHLEDVVEHAESAADTYVGACRAAERRHYSEHEGALRELAARLDIRMVATHGPH